MALGFQDGTLNCRVLTLALAALAAPLEFAAARAEEKAAPLQIAQVIEDAIPRKSNSRTRSTGEVVPGPDVETPSPEQIRNWIRDLGHARFEVREQATRKLEHCGAEAVKPLLIAIDESESLEVMARAIRSLQGILDYGDENGFDAAERELEKLSEARNTSIARRAAAALAGQNLARRRHAIARIRKLGGIVRLYPQELDPFREPASTVTDDEENITGKLHVILSSDWKGGNEGLVNIRRLGGPPWYPLSDVYVTTTSGITDEAMAELQKKIPGLEPIRRGGAMLGVSFPSQNPCIVGTVQPGSGAERAGLRQNDIIVAYDGVVLKDFKQLTEITGTHAPGDKVVLEIVRDNKTLKVEVELTGWK